MKRNINNNSTSRGLPGSRITRYKACQEYLLCGSLSGDNMTAAIQSFVNEMSTKPEEWGFIPVQFVHGALQKIVPCE